jgi:peptidoglycan/xylan/chitin deacetylase (PgdA/CDA1 family)
MCLPLALMNGCVDTEDAPDAEAAGAGGSSGSAGEGGEGPPAVVLPPPPVPAGPSEQPAPSGTESNLRVLPWAGFAAAVTYTFDDSQPSHLEHFGALNALGVPFTFYVNPSQNRQASYDSTWQAAIAAGHEIGNHTMNHCRSTLTECAQNAGSVEEEIDQCTTYIGTRLAQGAVWTFAYPYGDGGYAQYAPSRFLLARGVQSGMIAHDGATDPFRLPAIAAAGGEAGSVFSGHIDSAVTQSRWVIFLFHTVLPTSQNWGAGVDIASISQSVEHARSLGNVWVDSVANIGAYLLGQRAFAAATLTTEGDSSSWTWTLPEPFPSGRVLRVTVDGGTLSQAGQPLAWDGHGYYEVSLDARSLTWSP